MTSRPRVSVIMPVYNGAALVGRALRTVFNQTFADFEVIVVDDCSTDDLDKALAPFADPRLQCLRHDTNKGASAARNTAIQQAQGKYIAFIDYDDEWLPTKLEVQLERIAARSSDRPVSITGYYLVRDRLGRREARPLPDEADWYMRLLAGCNVSPGSCMLVHRAVFDDIGLFDEKMRRLEDWDWLLRYTATKPIANVPEPLAIIHTGITWPSAEAVAQALEQIRVRHEKRAAGHSAAAQRLLLATMRYEYAAAFYHHGRPLAAAWSVLRGLMIYPERGGAFYRHLLRRGRDAVLRRAG